MKHKDKTEEKDKFKTEPVFMSGLTPEDIIVFVSGMEGIVVGITQSGKRDDIDFTLSVSFDKKDLSPCLNLTGKADDSFMVKRKMTKEEIKISEAQAKGKKGWLSWWT